MDVQISIDLKSWSIYCGDTEGVCALPSVVGNYAANYTHQIAVDDETSNLGSLLFQDFTSIYSG